MRVDEAHKRFILIYLRFGGRKGIAPEATFFMHMTRASSLTRMLSPPLSRVPRRRIFLNNNQLSTLPAPVFNDLTKLQ
jgi:hypothetical protein